MTTIVDVDDVAILAARAAVELDRTSARERAGWLVELAATLESHREELVALAARETHLSTGRLDGELTRTANQLRHFAEVCREGSFLEATIDEADPAAKPPRPDLRRLLRPLGTVAVFSASNFPFAFSVLGGDTASALAAGCPVIVKAHPGHPALSTRTAQLAVDALRRAGAPHGTFALVDGYEAGVALVQAPQVTAVGFTGSVKGGRALWDLACSRPEPIPFYGELGSVNPVVVTGAAIAERGGELAAGLVGSFTRDGGQYCTKPGVVFIPAESGFEDLVVSAMQHAPTARMLTETIDRAFRAGSAGLATRDDVDPVCGVVAEFDDVDRLAPLVFATTVDAVLASADELLDEVFGPVTLLVRYRDRAELVAALDVLPGSLTGTIHSGADDEVDDLIELLGRRCGRLIFGGWPTGVAVAWAQHHGGPWPATTASVHTSVGASAIRRFLRPFTYQDAPQGLLPEPLRNDNPLGLPRRLNGVLTV